MDVGNNEAESHWYAMRDLSRSNSKTPAYKVLAEMQYELFTPMIRKVFVEKGRRISREVPFMPDLLFVHSQREELDPVVGKIPTLQYRYIYGGFCEPMIVRDADMERFIYAVKQSESPRYFRPEEITPQMYGHRVRIIGGNLDGYEGALLSVRGSKYRRLLIALPNFITAAIEVQPDLIEVLE